MNTIITTLPTEFQQEPTKTDICLLFEALFVRKDKAYKVDFDFPVQEGNLLGVRIREYLSPTECEEQGVGFQDYEDENVLYELPYPAKNIKSIVKSLRQGGLL